MLPLILFIVSLCHQIKSSQQQKLNGLLVFVRSAAFLKALDLLLIFLALFLAWLAVRRLTALGLILKIKEAF